MTEDPWLVALDIDGTTLREDGTVSTAVAAQISRLAQAGHEVMLATGRSPAATLPILDLLGIAPRFIVCSNGATTLERDAGGDYRRARVETFDPTSILMSIRAHLPNARYAIEDEHGRYLFTAPFPGSAIGMDSEHVDFVEFEALLNRVACRVVVVSPGHDLDDFHAVVERMGLRRVSFAIGWSAWLDIAADGVNKATAMERVRLQLGLPRRRVLAVADGRNDLELLTWATEHGRGVAMGHSPADVRAAAGEVTATVMEDGLAQVLATVPS
jgi:Cof subfamily protein (haloacid dehalogenase superfamily)